MQFFSLKRLPYFQPSHGEETFEFQNGKGKRR
jgi:hypothetical protein